MFEISNVLFWRTAFLIAMLVGLLLVSGLGRFITPLGRRAARLRSKRARSARHRKAFC